MKYARKSRKRTMRKRRYIRKKRVAKTGNMLRTIRWSNRDTTNLCHFTINGTAGGASVPLTTTFNLTDVAGSGEFQSLFDNYMLKKVYYRWVLRRDPIQGSTAGVPPRIIWVHDFNDQLAPASYAQLRQYANCREIILTEDKNTSRWYSINAASLPLTYVTSVSSATGPKWRQWFDTSSPSVPHYGIKYAIDGLYTNISVYLECKYELLFKGVS